MSIPTNYNGPDVGIGFIILLLCLRIRLLLAQLTKLRTIAYQSFEIFSRKIFGARTGKGVVHPDVLPIVRQKSSSFCDKRISSEVIETNDGEVPAVIAFLASRSSVPSRRVWVMSRGIGYVGMWASIGTDVSRNERRREKASTWVLSSPFLYRTSK